MPHLGVRGHGGSSHPSLGGGLGCPGHPAPAGLTRRLPQGGCQAAGGLKGEAAAGPEAREQHGRGAVPGAAAAGRSQTNSEWVGGRKQ